MQSAIACSLILPSDYKTFPEPVGLTLLRESATIDWVSIEAPEPRKCVLDQINWPKCKGEPPVFSAVVRERLTGDSEPRFALTSYRRGNSIASPLADPREFDIEGQVHFAARQRAIAETRHASLSFWDRGVLDIPADNFGGVTACGGGVAAADPDTDYIAFRDDQGVVLALEPVSYDDDTLVRRLREFANDPPAFSSVEVAPEEFFRSVAEISLVKITKCAERKRQSTTSGRFKLLAGKETKLNERLFGLEEYFASVGGRCRIGDKLVIAHLRLEQPRPWVPDEAWLDHRFPSRLRKDGLTRRPISIEYKNPARLMRVRNGRIRLADIQTGLTLIGPREITVEQAFAWQAEGLRP